MALTPTEQAAIQIHLGWVLNPTVLLVNGNVVSHQITSLLRKLVYDTPVEAEFFVREALCELQRINDERKGLRKRAGIVQSGDVKLDTPGGFQTLDDEFAYWARRLADIYGQHSNAYSQLLSRVGAQTPFLADGFP
jgi:hypothetical protein